VPSTDTKKKKRFIRELGIRNEQVEIRRLPLLTSAGPFRKWANEAYVLDSVGARRAATLGCDLIPFSAFGQEFVVPKGQLAQLKLQRSRGYVCVRPDLLSRCCSISLWISGRHSA
jgi:hypothetical protein